MKKSKYIKDFRENRKIISNSKLLVNLPILMLIAFYAFSIAFLFIGPFKWDLISSSKLLVFLTLSYVLLFFGYFFWRPQTYKEIGFCSVHKTVVYTKGFKCIFIISLFSAFLFLIINMFFTFHDYPGNIFELLLNPGAGYRYAKTVLASLDAGVPTRSMQIFGKLNIIAVLISGSVHIYLVLGVLFFKQLSKLERIFFIATFSFNVFFNIISGRQITFAQMFFDILPVFIYYCFHNNRIISLYSSGLSYYKKEKMKANFKRIVLIVLCSLIVLFGIFSVFLQTRTSTMDAAKVVKSMGLDFENNPSWDNTENIPQILIFSVSLVGFYISHGYIGLDGALNLPFVFTYGLGSSRAINSYFNKFFETPDVSQSTYPARNQAETDYPSLALWVTIFPWLASDITFVGVFLLMFLVGLLFKSVWRQCLVFKNPMAFVLMAQLFIGLIMIVANNQLFHTLESLCTFMLILTLYLYTLLPKQVKKSQSKYIKNRGG